MIAILGIVTSVVATIGVVIMLCPMAVMRLIVRFYPADDDRRRELVAEVYAVPTRDRLSWIIDQLLLGASEGRAARRSAKAISGYAEHANDAEEANDAEDPAVVAVRALLTSNRALMIDPNVIDPKVLSLADDDLRHYLDQLPTSKLEQMLRAHVMAPFDE